MTDAIATVLQLEERRLRALVERDMTAADEIHAADYELINPGGIVRSRSAYLEDVASKRLDYVVFEPVTPIAVRGSADLIVLRYVARIAVADEVEFRAWHTDHYEKRDEQWVAVWSQATRIRD
ncbi:nuclear transport factor 2 family protein [Luteipulveratus mongoliensis]|uniref:DUF4440 domain-containing protein n=1 Tax=Luteipulveratus mongoliensis TaxID=571913 RepID=A0A0K1JMS6_9MICO|nr:nuclear transport factor 2 family protein [Luteipulveratus mongoliensis]AKU17883.1 hypothetical protein VV02_21840 [Luteipulveratus mongoliensis]